MTEEYTHEQRKRIVLNFINARQNHSAIAGSYKLLLVYLQYEYEQLHPQNQTFTLTESDAMMYFEQLIATVTAARLDVALDREHAYDRLFECYSVLLPTIDFKEHVIAPSSWEKKIERLDQRVKEVLDILSRRENEDNWTKDDDNILYKMRDELTSMKPNVDQIREGSERRENEIEPVLTRIEL